jgi:hypothetical protein
VLRQIGQADDPDESPRRVHAHDSGLLIHGHQVFGLSKIILWTTCNHLGGQNVADGGGRRSGVCEHTNREISIGDGADHLPGSVAHWEKSNV